MSAGRQLLASSHGAVLDDFEEQPSRFRVLAGHFAALAPLSEAELGLLRDLAATSRYHPPRRDIWATGAPPPPPRMLVAGWACRYRPLANGRRQIICFVLPGDFVGPMLQPRLPSTCAVAALTEVETSSAKPLADAAASAEPAYPALAHAVRMAAIRDEALLCDQIVRLGQQTAGERLAHLMLEFRDRLGLLGLATGNRFTLPLTQEMLADALGLSVVHLNRTLQQLRRDGLLQIKDGLVTLPQPERLQLLAGHTVARPQITGPASR